MNKITTKELVQLSIFSAIIVLMGAIPHLGFIRIPFFTISITIIFIPVIMGASFLKPRYAIILGLVFGLISFVVAIFRPVTPIDLAFRNPLVSVLPRVLFIIIYLYLIKLFSTVSNTIIMLILALIGIIAIISYIAYEITFSLVIGIFLVIVVGLMIVFKEKLKQKDYKYFISAFLAIFIHGIMVLSLIVLFNPEIFANDTAFLVVIGILATNTLFEAMLCSVIIQLVVPRVLKVANE